MFVRRYAGVARLALLAVVSLLPVFVVSASSGPSENPNPDAVWLAESHNLSKLQTADGAPLFVLDERGINAMAADPRRGTLWSYKRERVTSYHPDGERRTVTQLSGNEDGDSHAPDDPGGAGEQNGERRPELAADPADGAVWVARAENVTRIGRSGSIEWRQALSEEVEATALDTERGRLWLAQDERLVAVTADGGHTANLDLERLDINPQALAYAPKLEALWLAGEERLVRLAPDGAIQYQSAFEDAQHLAADHHGGLWLASERRLWHVDSSGLVRLELRPLSRAGEIIDLAANPANGTVWRLPRKASRGWTAPAPSPIERNCAAPSIRAARGRWPCSPTSPRRSSMSRRPRRTPSTTAGQLRCNLPTATWAAA